ncbi:MAG: hypothetical protein HYU98_02250, partial [Deltaproteobacteria bacterium]|nr:hypothetical protein [Deltaproteobacteria bacterium]
SFDKAKAEKLDEEAQNFFKSSPLSGFIKELQKSGLPSDNYPYYIVKGDLGDF